MMIGNGTRPRCSLHHSYASTIFIAGAPLGDPALAGHSPDAAAVAGGQQQAAGQGQQQQGQQRKGKDGKPGPPPDDRNFLQKNWIFMVPVGLLVRDILVSRCCPFQQFFIQLKA